MNAASNFATATYALRWPIVATVLAAWLAIWTARKVNAWADAEIAATVEAALMCEDYDWLFESECFVDNRDDRDGWDWLYDQAASLPADAIWFGAEVLADLDELEDWSA